MSTRGRPAPGQHTQEKGEKKKTRGPKIYQRPAGINHQSCDSQRDPNTWYHEEHHHTNRQHNVELSYLIERRSVARRATFYMLSRRLERERSTEEGRNGTNRLAFSCSRLNTTPSGAHWLPSRIYLGSEKKIHKKSSFPYTCTHIFFS